MAWTERYVRADAAGGGDGTTDTNSGANGAWTLAEAIAAVAAGQRVNVRAGTYASTTTDRTFATAGTTTAPIWWRGFNAAPGDLDADPVTAKPLWSFTTGRVVISAGHQYFTNLNINGAQTSNGQIRLTGANCRFDRVRLECTAANANGRALSFSTGGSDSHWTRCWFKATSTPGSVIDVGAINDPIFAGCALEGGGIGISLSTSRVFVFFSSFNNLGGDGINMNGAGRLICLNSTFYSCGSDGIEFAAAPALALIAGCLFSENAGYGINNSTGTNTNLVTRLQNAFYSNTSGKENGFGDAPSLSEIVESASPFTNGAGGDLSLVATALSKAAGIPGLFENQSYTSYLDIGAVQRQEPVPGVGPRVWQNRVIAVPVY